MVTPFASVPAIEAMSFSTITSIVAVVTLIMCLFTRELSSEENSLFQENIYRYTTASILPLVLAFIAIVIIIIVKIV